MSTASNSEWQEYYDYLDELRMSGTTNMFAAVPYLEYKFFLSNKTAREILASWMKEFSE